jgi:drug/metabolite transporter (DMT)-like permease
MRISSAIRPSLKGPTLQGKVKRARVFAILRYGGRVVLKVGVVAVTAFRETLKPRTGALALSALVLGAAAIGFAPIFVRLSDVDPAAIGFWRVALSLPFFYLWMGAQKAPAAPPPRGKLLRGFALAGVLFALDLAFWHWSLRFTSVASATLISNLTPIVVAAGAVLLFHEKLTGKFWIGLALAVTGAALLAGEGAAHGHLWGDMLALITAFFYGSYLLALGRLRRDVPTATLMLGTGAVAALALIPISLATENVFFPQSMDGWLTLIGLALVCQFLGQGLIAFAFAHLPSAFGAVTLLVQPVVAAAAAWVLFGEVLGYPDFAGAAAILSGIVLARFGTKPAA